MELKTIDRLKQFIDHKELSLTTFDTRIGAGVGYIGKQIKRHGSVGSDIIETIVREWPELNISWLLTGHGNMLIEKEKKKGSGLMLNEPGVNYGKDVITMPVMDLQFAAGASQYNSSYLETVDNIAIPTTWVKKGKTFACGRIKGHSMAPTMLDSGYVIIRLLERQEWQEMPNEEVYVVVSKDDSEANAQLKRVKNRFERGFITLMADNPDKPSYPNSNLELDEIVNIWHVDWYFTKKMPNIHNQYYSRLQELENKVDDLVHDLRATIKLK